MCNACTLGKKSGHLLKIRMMISGPDAQKLHISPLRIGACVWLIADFPKNQQFATSDDLLAGRVESVAAIAKREGILPNYVRRLTRLAFLSPTIVEAIAAGHQPPALTAKALTERIELPPIWSEQERSVGIS